MSLEEKCRRLSEKAEKLDRFGKRGQAFKKRKQIWRLVLEDWIARQPKCPNILIEKKRNRMKGIVIRKKICNSTNYHVYISKEQNSSYWKCGDCGYLTYGKGD